MPYSRSLFSRAGREWISDIPAMICPGSLWKLMQKLVLKLGDVKQPRCPGEMNRDMSLSAQVSQLSGTSYWPDC